MNTYWVIVPRSNTGQNTLNLHKGDGSIYFDYTTAELHRDKMLNNNNMEVRCVTIQPHSVPMREADVHHLGN